MNTRIAITMAFLIILSQLLAVVALAIAFSCNRTWLTTGLWLLALACQYVPIIWVARQQTDSLS